MSENLLEPGKLQRGRADRTINKDTLGQNNRRQASPVDWSDRLDRTSIAPVKDCISSRDEPRSAFN